MNLYHNEILFCVGSISLLSTLLKNQTYKRHTASNKQMRENLIEKFN